ncbi:MAG: GNAT family N-acetyltransferase, partial [Actinomycetota bacterium]
RLLGDAGFRPDFFRSLLARDLDLDLDVGVGVGVDRDPAPAAPASPYRIVAVQGADVDRWLDVIAEGNAITSAAGRARSDEYAVAAHAAPGAVDFLAFDGNDPVGCGSIQVAGTAAWLGGAATRPDHRGRGVQAALLAHRLAEARARGCTVAAATATPGGISARNLQRAGLRPVDMQLVLTQRR